MAPTDWHRRPLPRVISPPFPTASTTLIFDSSGEDRWSNDSSSDPAAGYSALFTSGFLQTHMQRSPSCTREYGTTEIIHGPFHPSPERSPRKHHSVPSPSPTKTPVRRRRSSIMHATPMSASPRVIKSGGTDNGVERAIDNVMRSLKVMAMGTPLRDSSIREQSRWSLSSEESGTTEESGFWRSRKSEESSRSRVTVGTMRSTKSTRSRRSKKSRKSEDTDRMDLDLEEDIPPVPIPAPATPSRRKRMMEGLAKKLGLTPKKMPSPLPEPEVPMTPRLPRKSSFSTLRSAINKKTSTGTLRSFRSTKSSVHPFMGSGPTLDCETYPPPLPTWRDGEIGEGCLPVTSRRRTTKSSVGQPRLQLSTSPSSFLKGQPRRAPDRPNIPPLPDVVNNLTGPLRSAPSAISLREKLRRAEQRTRQDRSREDTPELSPMAMAAWGYGTPETVSSASVDTPLTVIETPDQDASEIIASNTPPPTHRAAQNALRPKRLLHLLPQASRTNLGLLTPPSTGLRSKKSANIRPVLGDVTNRGSDTPDSISSVLVQANKPKHPFAGGCFQSASPSPNLDKPAARRDLPLILDRRKEPSKVSPDSPIPSGKGRGWHTAAPEGGEDLDKTFGAAQGVETLSVRKRDGIPDFTLSPQPSFSSFASSRKTDSDASMDSDLPTEEWELEAYLKALERVDREREDAAAVGVGR